jgi:LacI family transcriptional regulator
MTPPTIKVIAKKANVSIATVSRALNNDHRVKDETRNLILKISKELNYNPNLLARSFVKRQSNVVGLILPDIYDEFFTEIIRGVDEVTFSAKFFTMVASSHKYRSLAESVATFIKGGMLGGIIILVSSLTEEFIKVIDQSRIPVVLITGSDQKTKYDTITIDNYQGAFGMTEFLLRTKNYKNPVHISGPADNDDAVFRKKGFIDACKKNNLNISKSSILLGDFSRESGEAAFFSAAKMRNKPDVIFAANDMMALGCYDAAANLRLKIPDDIAIAGFDDIFVSKYLSPGLTTVRVQIEEVGKAAAEILIKKMTQDQSYTLHSIRISTELKIRESC